MSEPDRVVLDAPSGRTPGALAAVAASDLVLALCMTMLFLGMRDIMDLGGFVASGGPYVIAHPAPGWVWVMPLSIVLGLAAAFGNAVAASRAHGFNLAVAAWPALFLSLGWNFLSTACTRRAAVSRPPGWSARSSSSRSAGLCSTSWSKPRHRR